LKYQIRQHFINHLKKLLPTSSTFKEPKSFIERRSECIRYTNFHILTCTSKDCQYTENNQHNSSQLFKIFLENSFKTFPKNEAELWKEPTINSSIFHIDEKYEASFSNPVPVKVLDELANEAERFVCKNNSVPTNSKRRNYYFYKYLNTYHQIAAQNHNIADFSKEKAMEAITNKPIDTHFLARIITYYDLVKDQTPTYPQITKFYKESSYPEAETYLAQKFNINFTEPILIEDSLFFLESSFQ
jgi:hypothetical protein